MNSWELAKREVVATTVFRKITLCGSARFAEAYCTWNVLLTLSGALVYSIEMLLSGPIIPTVKQKELLDCIHLAKIDNSDEIFVLDVNGYIGDSTRRDILYAESKGKIVRYLSKDYPNWVEGLCTLIQD